MPDFIKVSRVTWSNYENGNTQPDIDRLIEIAELFKVSIDDLVKIDLSTNMALVENNAPRHVSYSTEHFEESHLLNEAEVTYASKIKNEVDLLILRQLNSIADEVAAIKEKLA